LHKTIDNLRDTLAQQLQTKERLEAEIDMLRSDISVIRENDKSRIEEIHNSREQVNSVIYL
jgi:hypothetical protein